VARRTITEYAEELKERYFGALREEKSKMSLTQTEEYLQFCLKSRTTGQ
jgi:hypothetical protein